MSSKGEFTISFNEFLAARIHVKRPRDLLAAVVRSCGHSTAFNLPHPSLFQWVNEAMFEDF